MKRNVLKLRVKARRLLKLYSAWHETRRRDVCQRWLKLAGEILALNPRFNLKREFREAF